MKIERDKKVFEPITINLTFEHMDEIDSLSRAIAINDLHPQRCATLGMVLRDLKYENKRFNT